METSNDTTVNLKFRNRKQQRLRQECNNNNAAFDSDLIKTGISCESSVALATLKLEENIYELDSIVLQEGNANNKEMINSNLKFCRNTSCGKSLLEISIRIILFIIFIQLERVPAFRRNIHPEELWLYKNPQTADYVPAAYLMPASFIIPFTIILINYLITHDRYDFTQGNNAMTLALALNGVLTSLIKITVGRPRPDYFYRCFPDGNNSNIQMNCLGSISVVNEGRKSFPSGHSSFAFAGLGFVFLYLAAKLHIFNERGRGQSWRLCITLSPLIIALLVAISRTCDYHHHWEDVTIGSLLGMTVTFICYRQYYPSIFSNHPQKPYQIRSVLNTTMNNHNGGSKNFVPIQITNPAVTETTNNQNINGEQNPLLADEEKDTKWI